MISRGAFLELTAASTLAAASRPAAAPAPASSELFANRSLILSGGGALGAYEAGAIASLAAAAGIPDGRPLPQYGVIAGTSIGALNGYLAATGQWSKLADLWSLIATQNVVRFKKQYASIGNADSGVGNRVAQMLSIALGAGKNVTGLYDGEYLRAFLARYLDVSKPILTPFFWAVTNLTREMPEYFYAFPAGTDSSLRRAALESLFLALGPVITVRECDPAQFIDQLRASAAVPVAFDPVALASADGTTEMYADGGVTANTPVTIGRALSRNIDAILLAPPFKHPRYHDLVEIMLGSYDTMQRRLMADALRSGVTETLLFRLLQSLPATQFGVVADRVGFDPTELRHLITALSDAQFFVLQPDDALPASLLGFNDPAGIERTYERGRKDAARGFTRFDARRYM